MTTLPQAILIIGGMTNLVISSLAGYVLLWIRMRDPKQAISSQTSREKNLTSDI